jgi:hypothetical protein
VVCACGLSPGWEGESARRRRRALPGRPADRGRSSLLFAAVSSARGAPQGCGEVRAPEETASASPHPGASEGAGWPADSPTRAVAPDLPFLREPGPGSERPSSTSPGSPGREGGSAAVCGSLPPGATRGQAGGGRGRGPEERWPLRWKDRGPRTNVVRPTARGAHPAPCLFSSGTAGM